MIKVKLIDAKRNLKSKIQRFIRGYADEDVWQMDYWFINIIPKMLRQLRDKGMGYPSKLKSKEEWHDELNKMIYYDMQMHKSETNMKYLRLIDTMCLKLKCNDFCGDLSRSLYT